MYPSPRERQHFSSSLRTDLGPLWLGGSTPAKQAAPVQAQGLVIFLVTRDSMSHLIDAKTDVWHVLNSQIQKTAGLTKDSKENSHLSEESSVLPQLRWFCMPHWPR